MKIFWSWFLFTFLEFLFALQLAASQLSDYPNDPSENPLKPEYQSVSRSVVLRVVPGDKTAKLFVAGHKTATADLSKQPVVVSVTAWNQGESEILDFRRDGDGYLITELPKWREPYDINVKLESRGNLEEMKVRIGDQAP